MREFVPVPIQQRSKFEAQDPWDPMGTTVTWKLSNYAFEGLRQNTPVPGIATVSGTRYRILPLALGPLLEQGTIQPQQLPALLHRVERSLRSSDYPPRQTFGDSGLALMLVACLPLWLAWEIGFEGDDKLFPQLVATIGIGFFLLGFWTLAQAPLRRLRERRLAKRFRHLIANLERGA